MMFRNPPRQFFHQLSLQQARVIDVFARGSLQTFGLRFAPGFVTWRIFVSIFISFPSSP